MRRIGALSGTTSPKDCCSNDRSRLLGQRAAPPSMSDGGRLVDAESEPGIGSSTGFVKLSGSKILHRLATLFCLGLF